MKMLIKGKVQILDAYRGFLSRKEIKMLFFYICLYAIYSLNIIPQGIMLSLIAVVFIIASVKCSFLMFLFFTLWENVAVYSSGVTLVMILQLIMFTKIIFYYIAARKPMFYSFLDFTICLLSFFYGILDYFLGTGGLTGISLGVNILIAIYAHNIYRDKNASEVFWKSVFFTIMLSTIFAVIFGFTGDTALDRWVVGVGFVKQLYATVGTARIGMFLCASLIYPVFYMNNRTLKIIFCTLLCLGVLMTFSITSLICLVVFWLMIFLFKDTGNLRSSLKKIALVSLVSTAVILTWSSIQEVELIKPLFIRAGSLIRGFESGDISVATSSRSYLARVYLDDYKSHSLFNKLFGSFYTSRFKALASYSGVGNHSHNSFIDILLYSGVLGLLAYFVWMLVRISTLRGRKEFMPVIMLKVIFLLTGFSVSMFTSCYWFVWAIL